MVTHDEKSKSTTNSTTIFIKNNLHVVVIKMVETYINHTIQTNKIIQVDRHICVLVYHFVDRRYCILLCRRPC